MGFYTSVGQQFSIFPLLFYFYLLKLGETHCHEAYSYIVQPIFQPFKFPLATQSPNKIPSGCWLKVLKPISKLTSWTAKGQLTVLVTCIQKKINPLNTSSNESALHVQKMSFEAFCCLKKKTKKILNFQLVLRHILSPLIV